MTKQDKLARPYVEVALLEQVRKRLPETKGLTYSGLVSVALRRLLALLPEKETKK